jgi:hypothetical protein
MVRRTLRVLTVVAVLAGTVAAIVVALQRRRTAATPPTSPTSPTSPAHSSAPVEPTEPTAAAPTAPIWLPASDGQCPDGYPVKVNESSGIFHVPGGRFYARTIPDRCYAVAEDAVADGYRQAKA